MLSAKETKSLIALLAKIGNPEQGLPQAVFEALTRIVPQVACELIIANKKNELLLTWREDKYWRGWHFPGGLIRMNESFKERIEATAKRELGIKIINSKFLFPVNYRYSPRGQAISLVFSCECAGKPRDGKFFGKIPKDIIGEHKKIWKMIKNRTCAFQGSPLRRRS